VPPKVLPKKSPCTSSIVKVCRAVYGMACTGAIIETPNASPVKKMISFDLFIELSSFVELYLE